MDNHTFLNKLFACKVQQFICNIARNCKVNNHSYFKIWCINLLYRCSIAVIRNLTKSGCGIVNTYDMIKELIDARDGFNTINYSNLDEILSFIESVCTC